MRLVAAALALTTGAPALGQGLAPRAPLSTWLEGIADSAVALAEGDPARAEVSARSALVALPRGGSSARADLALGFALHDARRCAEAAATLSRALPGLEDATLAAAARFQLAEALLCSGHPAQAAPLFAETAARGPQALAGRATWREADALLQSGAARAAAQGYQRLLANHPAHPAAPGARLSLGAALRAAGEDATAVATWRALWIESPADPAGRAAGRALRTWRRAGGPVPLPSVEERLARAERFLELAMPRRALRTLERLPAVMPAAEPAARAALLRALALLQLGRRQEADTAARPLAKSGVASEGIQTGAALVLARVAARDGRLEEAAARYRDLSRHRATFVPGLTPAQARGLPEEAAYLAAWLFYDRGSYARGAALLRAFAREHPRSPRALDARWFEAWALVRAGRRGQARQALQRLERGPLEAQALYWLARLSTGGQGARAALYRRALRAAPPGSWYALLAASRLASWGEPPPPYPAAPATAPADGPGGGWAGERLADAVRLAGVGLAADALAELRVIAAGPDARSNAALVAELAEAVGDAELPFRMARDHLATTSRALQWLYPAAFRQLLGTAARDAGVDPLLYLSVMRRESSFRPDARSAAGAVGLVQLLPPTAERVAAVHGVERTRVRGLERPEVSVPLGAAYLSLLGDRFADPAVVIAAYNAGPAAVAGWVRDRTGMALDNWVEDIPYRETRRYVKAVVADLAVYRALRGGAGLSIDGARAVPSPRQGVGF